MPDIPNRLFEVACKGCHRPLVTVERLRNPEIAVVVDHLRACSISEPLGDTPMLGTIMRGLRVRAVDRQMNTSVPPDQAAVTAKRESR